MFMTTSGAWQPPDIPMTAVHMMTVASPMTGRGILSTRIMIFTKSLQLAMLDYHTFCHPPSSCFCHPVPVVQCHPVPAIHCHPFPVIHCHPVSAGFLQFGTRSGGRREQVNTLDQNFYSTNYCRFMSLYEYCSHTVWHSVMSCFSCQWLRSLYVIFTFSLMMFFLSINELCKIYKLPYSSRTQSVHYSKIHMMSFRTDVKLSCKVLYHLTGKYVSRLTKYIGRSGVICLAQDKGADHMIRSRAILVYHMTCLEPGRAASLGAHLSLFMMMRCVCNR